MDDERKKLTFSVGYYDGEYIWCINSSFGGMFKVDINTYQAEFLGMLPTKDNFLPSVYSKVYFRENILYFVPMFEEPIILYNLLTKQVKAISIDDKKRYNRFGVSSFLPDSEDLIWLFPFNLKQPIKTFNIRSMEIKELYWWNDSILKSLSNNNIFMGRPSYDGDTVYATVFGTNKLMEANLLTLEIKIHEFSCGKHFFDSVNKDNYLYVDFMDSFNILILNVKNREMEEIEVLHEEVADNPYSDIIILGNKIIPVPRYGKQFTIIDRVTKTVQYLNYPPQILFYKTDILQTDFYGFLVKDNKVILYPYYSNGLVKIDVDSMNVEFHEIIFPKELNENWFKENIDYNKIKANRIILEEKKQYLDVYLKIISEGCSNYEVEEFAGKGNNIMKIIKDTVYSK